VLSEAHEGAAQEKEQKQEKRQRKQIEEKRTNR